jgi:hypothetical protein
MQIQAIAGPSWYGFNMAIPKAFLIFSERMLEKAHG